MGEKNGNNPPASFRCRLARFLLLLASAYLGVLLMLLALENWFLFHPESASDSWVPPPCLVDDIELKVAGGPPFGGVPVSSLHGWWLKPRDWDPEQGAILFFHGNAGNLSHRGENVSPLRATSSGWPC